MKKSHNVLTIESVSANAVSENLISSATRTEMKARISFQCTVTGNIFYELIIKSTGTSNFPEEALRKTIENFINGNFYTVEKKIFNVKSESKPCKEIHHVDIKLPDPFKELFEQIFDASTWEIPKRELSS